MPRHFSEEELKKVEGYWTSQSAYLEEVETLPNEAPQYLICDKVNGAVLFEDNDLHDYIVDQMIKHGKKVVSSAEIHAQDLANARQAAIKRFLPLWTTERDKTRLVAIKMSNSDLISYLIFNQFGQMIRLKSKYMYEYVVSHMRDAGVKVVEMQDLLAEWQYIAEQDAKDREVTE